ncbi:hypothetical protein [Stappia sp. MMSF_3263]|uniref:hypothetical protein n=1 Tax=Stappia sp. MMSF_3263 TaxID=3046693 RepID=UPI00273FB4C3|nr:hypothetical protein [Stappia sp. MMSF_3263]
MSPTSAPRFARPSPICALRWRRGGGARTADVFKLTVLIVDHTMERLVIFGEELARAFGPGMKPACTLIPVPCLALEGMLFEVEALAAVSP